MLATAGRPLSAGRHLRRRGHQLLAVLRGRRQGRTVPDRQGRHRDHASSSTRSTATSGTPTCRPSPPASATASGCTGRGTRAPGTAATPASCCSTRTASPSTATSTSPRRCSPTTWTAEDLASGGTPPMVDSLGHTMTSVVINPFFDWASDRAPRTPVPRDDHLRGPRQGHDPTHPGIPEELRGTYAGLAHPAIIDHLKSLNVTAIELMPVHQFMHDHRLLDLGLRNYWGYNTFGFFAPHYQYAATQHAGGAVAEFKAMVRSFHEAGIEVILDVVYNHTAEGNHLGPDHQLPRHRQRRLLPAARRRPAVLQGLHRHRQQPQRPASAHPAADHGLAALLGARDARRRVPLRPGLHPGPRILRRRPAVARSSIWCSRIRWSVRSS